MTTLNQLQHYETLFAATPKFVVLPCGEIAINPARSFRRKRIYQLKQMLLCN